MAAAAARTYESALSDLAALQSNRAITSLFTPPAPLLPSSTTGTGAETGKTDKKQDLNALAIPEMLAWLERSGLSRADIAKSGLRCVHVAGTKGKGSVCAYLTALLLGRSEAEAQGEEEGEGTRGLAGKVGTYTSPHLVSVRERIAIDGAPISPDLFARYFYEVWDACTEAARRELMARRARKEDDDSTEIKEKEEEDQEQKTISEEELQGPSTKPFFFRFLTIVALRAFIGEGVRTAVVECGIGGEYDSTNVLPAETVTASVVTQLGIDHVGMLGGTLPEIAWHKAGVCKPGRKCFTRRLTGTADAEETMRVLRRRAAEKGATLVEVDDADVERWGGMQAIDGAEGGERDGTGSLEGEFQKYNQALAVLAAREHLRVLEREFSSLASPSPSSSSLRHASTNPSKQQYQQQRPESETAEVEIEKLEDVPPTFTSALRHARLRGRCETRADEHAPVTWLIDGAHTAESLAEVARWYSGKVNSSLRAASQTNQKSRTNNKGKEQRILLFNQQDRDAARLVTGLVRDIAIHTQKSDTHTDPTQSHQKPEQPLPRPKLFTHAIFTRNDLLPPPRQTKTDSKTEIESVTGTEPERDLSVQKAAAEAFRRSLSADTDTEVEVGVFDNVSDAVARVRALARAGDINNRKIDDNEDDDDSGDREGTGAGSVRTTGTTGTNTTVLVTGSLHLVGALLRTLEPDSAL